MLVLECTFTPPSSPQNESETPFYLEIIGRARLRTDVVKEAKFEVFRIHKTLGEDSCADLLTSMILKSADQLFFRFVCPYCAGDLIHFTAIDPIGTTEEPQRPPQGGDDKKDLVHLDIIQFHKSDQSAIRETQLILSPAAKPLCPAATTGTVAAAAEPAAAAAAEVEALPPWPLQASVFASIVPFLDLRTVSRLSQASRSVYDLMSHPMFWAMSTRRGDRPSTTNQLSLPPPALYAATYALPVGEEELTVASGDSTLTHFHQKLPIAVRDRLLIAVDAVQPLNLFCGKFCDLADQGIPCTWIEGTDFGWAKRFIISALSVTSGPLKCISGSGHNSVKLQYCLA